MDLNGDVVTEILANLPVKSVVRFKSVCKSWCSIIDSSAFRKSHLKNQSKNNNDDDDILFLHFSRKKNKNSTWELSSTLYVQDHYWKLGKDFPPPFHEFLNVNSWYDPIVCGPINGLICMYDNYPIKDDRLGWSISIAICNPCLGESKILPLSPVLLDSLIGCKKWAKPFKYRTIGFGFDSVTKDYKVVQVMWSLNGRAYVEVYSGRTNTWRVLDTGIFDDHRSYPEFIQIKMSYKSSGAAAYWRISGDVISSFDMQNEVFGIIRLPEFAKSRYSKVFAKDDDSLVMFAYPADYRRLEVWEMGKERVWSRVRDVNLLQFGKVAHPLPIALWNYGVVLWTLDSKMKDLIIFYDYSIEKQRKPTVEVPTPLGCERLYLEYKCTLNSLEICMN